MSELTKWRFDFGEVLEHTKSMAHGEVVERVEYGKGGEQKYRLSYTVQDRKFKTDWISANHLERAEL
jgi:hypothetical protein